MKRRRFLAVGALFLLGGAGLAQMSLGPYGVSPLAVIRALTDPEAPDRFFVLTLGMPRYVVGALAGLALGASGAIFQAVTRNPLASPDILGFGTGSATGAIAALLLTRGTPGSAAGMAVAGGLTTAAIVYGLGGGLRGSPRRLILTGIMISAVLTAVNGYLMFNADIQDIQVVLSWLAGSLNAASWADVPLLAIALVVLLVLSVLLRREFVVIELEDDRVVGLGARPSVLRSIWIVLGVLLVSVATAITGPISFVALAAPHITRRLRDGRLDGLILPALSGAILVTMSDAIAANVLPVNPPVGIVTGALGGLYLLTLLIRTAPHARSAGAH